MIVGKQSTKSDSRYDCAIIFKWLRYSSQVLFDDICHVTSWISAERNGLPVRAQKARNSLYSTQSTANLGLRVFAARFEVVVDDATTMVGKCKADPVTTLSRSTDIKDVLE